MHKTQAQLTNQVSIHSAHCTGTRSHLHAQNEEHEHGKAIFSTEYCRCDLLIVLNFSLETVLYSHTYKFKQTRTHTHKRRKLESEHWIWITKDLMHSQAMHKKVDNKAQLVWLEISCASRQFEWFHEMFCAFIRIRVFYSRTDYWVWKL